jgi:nitrogen fixation NifU-like protein
MSGEVKLDELYQEVILDHNKRPRNFGKLAGATSYAHGVNPLCGDDFHVYVRVEGGTVKAAGFEGSGCAISKASASLLTAAVEGKSVAEALAIEQNFIRLLTKETPTDAEREGAGRLKFFEGVRKFPIRVKCATLAWRALEEALKDENQRKPEVSTEAHGDKKVELS